MLIDVLRNIFGAGGGSTHPTVAAAAVYAMSMGLRAEHAGATGQDLADAYKYGFGDGMQWTHDETDQYWKLHGDDPYNVTDEAMDAYDSYVHWVREHMPDINASIMRGDTFAPPFKN
jgi:hypothetical protein